MSVLKKNLDYFFPFSYRAVDLCDMRFSLMELNALGINHLILSHHLKQIASISRPLRNVKLSEWSKLRSRHIINTSEIFNRICFCLKQNCSILRTSTVFYFVEKHATITFLSTGTCSNANILCIQYAIMMFT